MTHAPILCLLKITSLITLTKYTSRKLPSRHSIPKFVCILASADSSIKEGICIIKFAKQTVYRVWDTGYYYIYIRNFYNISVT